MKKYDAAIQDHYGHKDLGDRILSALAGAGKEIRSPADTSTFDEFHIRGLEATLEIGRLAELKQGMTVLDLGSGIGGPARTMAAEFGCRVTGIDLVDEYLRTAEMLTGMVGLGDRVTFKKGDMTDLPFGSGSFDRAFTIHTQMNVREKSKIFSEVLRVLSPGGQFAIYEICAGSNSPVHFPVPWANDPSISFLITPAELRDMLVRAGFREHEWLDMSAKSLEWFRSEMEAHASAPEDAPPPLGLNLIMGPDFAKKLGNVYKNLKEDRIRVVMGVYQSGS
jgi:ubiquinone/menaquinone biosynthesis C-methylase UbiE